MLYVPDDDVNGSDTYSWRAMVGDVESRVATVEFVVTPVNDPPSGVETSVVTPSGQQLTMALSASHVDGDPLVFAIVSSPSNGTFSLGPDGSLTYQPTAGFVGTDSLEWEARDPVGASTGPIPLTIEVVE